VDANARPTSANAQSDADEHELPANACHDKPDATSNCKCNAEPDGADAQPDGSEPDANAKWHADGTPGNESDAGSNAGSIDESADWTERTMESSRGHHDV